MAEQPISPKKRLAIQLYGLSRGDYYCTTAGMTGHGFSTKQNITIEVCNAIVSNLRHKSVIFSGSKDQMLRAIFKIESMYQFPGAFAGTDSCRIPLTCLHGGNKARTKYYDFKNIYSIAMMKIAAADYKFLCE